MKIIQYKCPSCGATLDSNKKIMYCSFCVEKVFIDDEETNVNFMYRKVDEARIEENKRKKMIRLKELKMKIKKSHVSLKKEHLCKGDIFLKDVPIIIRYHTFK